MGYLVDVLKFINSTNFQYKKEEQKYWLQFLMAHCDLDQETVSRLLKININLLERVLQGKDFFKQDIAIRLVNWVFISLRRS